MRNKRCHFLACCRSPFPKATALQTHTGCYTKKCTRPLMHRKHESLCSLFDSICARNQLHHPDTQLGKVVPHWRINQFNLDSAQIKTTRNAIFLILIYIPYSVWPWHICLPNAKRRTILFYYCGRVAQESPHATSVRAITKIACQINLCCSLIPAAISQSVKAWQSRETERKGGKLKGAVAECFY